MKYLGHALHVKRAVHLTVCLTGAATFCSVASAQNAAQPEELKAVYACKTKRDSNERLACYDAAIGNFENAEKSGDIVTFNAKDNEKEKRSLFGKKKKKEPLVKNPKAMKTIPRKSVDGNEIFGDNLRKVSFEISRTKVFGRQKNRFYLTNGQVWEQTEDKALRVPKVKNGKPNVANIRKGSLGNFFLTINKSGQSVKVKRVK